MKGKSRKELQEKMANRKKNNIERIEFDPIYDDIFFEGVNALENINKPEISNSEIKKD